MESIDWFEFIALICKFSVWLTRIYYKQAIKTRTETPAHILVQGCKVNQIFGGKKKSFILLKFENSSLNLLHIPRLTVRKEFPSNNALLIYGVFYDHRSRRVSMLVYLQNKWSLRTCCLKKKELGFCNFPLQEAVFVNEEYTA